MQHAATAVPADSPGQRADWICGQSDWIRGRMRAPGSAATILRGTTRGAPVSPALLRSEWCLFEHTFVRLWLGRGSADGNRAAAARVAGTPRS